MLGGEVDTGRAVLRDHIKATVGFEGVARATGFKATSLVRMFGADGNPTADNLFAVIGYLQRQESVRLAVEPKRAAPARQQPEAHAN